MVDDGKPTVELELEVEDADEPALVGVLEPLAMCSPCA